MAPAADHNLLFGILAWQMDFIKRDALLGAMQAWVFDKGKPLGQVLLDQGRLTAEQRQALDLLVQQHLKAHGNDPQQSLAAVPMAPLLHAELHSLADGDVQASLALVATLPSPHFDPAATLPPASPPNGPVGLRYRVLRPHAKGGLGEVFVALDEELHREVALKAIQEPYADQPASRARFVLEAEITGGLEHPGIVPVYGLGTDNNGRPCYAMRFIQGDSLKEAIDRFHAAEKPGRPAGERSLALRELLGQFVDVCQAVAYAHSRGVLHRDLKPGNVMLGKFGETLVVDWGLAKSVGRGEVPPPSSEHTLRPHTGSAEAMTQAGAVMGTPAFMSPEQAAGAVATLGPASDIYSLGATLYMLLTGQAPFQGAEPAVMLFQVQQGEFLPPRMIKPNVPPALEAVCIKAMARRPEDRYPTALELAAEVEHWLADEPVRAWREPWTRRARRWLGRHRGLASGAAAAVLVALASLAVATILLTAANARERAALGLVEQQKSLVEQQKAQTDENFRLARQAVDEYITKVSEDPRLKERDLEALRKNLLESALTFYQRFVEKHGDEVELQAEQAKALIRLADITESLSTRSEAIRLYEQALAIQERLAKEFPSNPTHAEALATTLRSLASLYHKTGRMSEADRTVRQSVAVAEALVRDQTSNDNSQRVLAASYLALAGNERESKHWQPAEELLGKANTLLSKLAERKAATASDIVLLAAAYHNSGEYFKDSGQPARAEQEFRKALTWIDACPPSVEVSEDMRQLLRGVAYFNLGELHRKGGKPKEAEADISKARDLLREAARKHPAVNDYQNMLAAANTLLAVLYSETGRLDLAEDSVREAMAVWQALARDDPSTTDHLKNLAAVKIVLVNLFDQTGRTSQAERHIREMLHVIETWLRLQPGASHILRQQAGAQMMLALNLRDTNRPQEADQTFRQGAALWDKLLRDYPEDEEIARNGASHFMAWGELLGGVRPRDALTNFQRAIALREAWLKRHATDLAARFALLQMRTRRAQLSQFLNQPKEALVDQQTVVAERERLAKEPADQPARRYQFAQSLDYLGQLYSQAGQTSQAEATYVREAALLEDLVRKQQTAQHLQASLAGVENQLGILYNEAQNFTKAETHYRRAIAAGQKAGTNPDRRVQLGGYHCNLAHNLRQLNRPEQALGEYAEASRILEDLWTDPDLAPNLHRTTRAYLGNTYQGRLSTLEGLGRSAESLSDEERLLQIDSGRYGNSVAFARALTVARLGLTRRAQAEADLLARRNQLNGLQLYLLAGCYAHVGKVERAVELLGKARTAGYFAAPSAVAYLKQDKDFENLKPRAEFQKFLAGLATR